jgi:Rod binding domain-containing protein
MDAIMQDTSLLLSQATQETARRSAAKISAIEPVKGPGQGEIDSRTMKAIEESARDFEAVFLSAMLKPIFEQIEVDNNFGGGKGEEVFRGLMVQEYGKMISETGTIGIAEHVKAELIRIQENANG